MALLSPLLQEILVCPQCRDKLIENEVERTLTCSCGLVFSVGEDGIPNMLIDDARRVSAIAPQENLSDISSRENLAPHAS